MDGNHVVSQQTTSIHDLLCVNWDAGRVAGGGEQGDGNLFNEQHRKLP